MWVFSCLYRGVCISRYIIHTKKCVYGLGGEYFPITLFLLVESAYNTLRLVLLSWAWRVDSTTTAVGAHQHLDGAE